MLPGSHRADSDLVRAMVRVEVAWARVLGSDIEPAVRNWTPELDPVEVEAAGNPVLPLVTALRSRVPAPVHTGLTSQDVLDTALVLLARDAVARVRADLVRVASALARLADEHRSSVMAGRTLTQHAVPITFGLKAARWLDSVLDALADLERLRFPVQCGGAAGTLSRAALRAGPVEAAAAFARELDLEWPGLPWHTQRAPITRIGDALVRVTDALGVFAADVLTLGRPEIGEVREAPVAGRGGSSTMPHKQNPVLAVLVNSASLRAPGLGAQLHLCAARAVDERPDGAWHAEWPALLGLVELTVVAASQAAELAEGLRVFPEVMARRVAEVAADLLAERGGDGEPGGYLGAAGVFVDHVLRRCAESLAVGALPVGEAEVSAVGAEPASADAAAAEPASASAAPAGPVGAGVAGAEPASADAAPTEPEPVAASAASAEPAPADAARADAARADAAQADAAADVASTGAAPTDAAPAGAAPTDASPADATSAGAAPADAASIDAASADAIPANAAPPIAVPAESIPTGPPPGGAQAPTPIISKGSDNNGG
ncbi:lyase family protein [Lentzea sp. NPDC042327]|uniref:lyase family protein n=1 Tax=Lentzea sp. NPDC042327 TaxID=3154801 RepID=UPI0033E66D51